MDVNAVSGKMPKQAPHLPNLSWRIAITRPQKSHGELRNLHLVFKLQLIQERLFFKKQTNLKTVDLRTFRIDHRPCAVTDIKNENIKNAQNAFSSRLKTLQMYRSLVAK